jgi:hypothetical protein
MKRHAWLLLVLMGFVSACASLNPGSDVQSGWLAFSIGNYQAAKDYFDAASKTDPDYIYRTDFPGGSSENRNAGKAKRAQAVGG